MNTCVEHTSRHQRRSVELGDVTMSSYMRRTTIRSQYKIYAHKELATLEETNFSSKTRIREI